LDKFEQLAGFRNDQNMSHARSSSNR